MPEIVTNLWFDTESEEAADHYVEVFSNRPGGERGESRIVSVSYYTEAGPREPGMVLTVDFLLEGQRFTAINGGPEFTFTEAVSLLVSCESQEEVDYFWDAFISAGGQEGPCGWLKDRYGLSWQIVPAEMDEMLGSPDREAAARAMRAMLRMRKIDLAALERAFVGA